MSIRKSIGATRVRKATEREMQYDHSIFKIAYISRKCKIVYPVTVRPAVSWAFKLNIPAVRPTRKHSSVSVHYLNDLRLDARVETSGVSQSRPARHSVAFTRYSRVNAVDEEKKKEKGWETSVVPDTGFLIILSDFRGKPSVYMRTIYHHLPLSPAVSYNRVVRQTTPYGEWVYYRCRRRRRHRRHSSRLMHALLRYAHLKLPSY